MSCTALPKTAKPVWTKQLTQLSCLVVSKVYILNPGAYTAGIEHSLLFKRETLRKKRFTIVLYFDKADSNNCTEKRGISSNSLASAFFTRKYHHLLHSKICKRHAVSSRYLPLLKV